MKLDIALTLFHGNNGTVTKRMVNKYRRRSLYYLIIITIIISTFLLYILSNYYNRPELFLKELQSIEKEVTINDELVEFQKTDRLFDLKLKYLINVSKSFEENSDDNITAVIIVTSYFGNVETRSAMRRAFPAEDLKKMQLRRVFLLGTTTHDAYTNQLEIENESKRFGDIIQGNFQEAYRNLTYKHLMGLKWASEYCSGARYIFKMDDDIVVNLVRIVRIVLDHFNNNNNHLLMAGYILRGMQPVREPANKWYVTHNEYSYTTYPTFVSGWFYVTTPKVARNLVVLAQQRDAKYFWIDDVYVTGLLALKLRVKHYDLSRYFTVLPEFIRCCIRNSNRSEDCEVVVGPNGGDNNLFYEFNRAMQVCEISNKCRKPEKPLNETCVAEWKVNLGKGNAIIENYKLN